MLMAPTFLLYVAFVVLAMMNVITGIFVDSALSNAQKIKERDFMTSLKKAFADEVDEDGYVSLQNFELKMQEAEMVDQLKQVGIAPQEAGLSFRLIDDECIGELPLND